MKQLSLLPVFLVCLLSITVSAVAQPLAATAQPAKNLAAVEEAIRARFVASRPGVALQSINPSQIPGMYTVKVAGGPTLYTTEDGRYFVVGDLYEVAPGGFVNLAEKEREGGRAEVMRQIKTDDMIVFSPAEKPVKAAIMVFTDVDCYYCQKLHQEVPDLNRLGIEVRYLAYPRAGIGSESYNKVVSAWCAKDQQTAMTQLKNRQRIATNLCSDNPVEAQFKLGQQVGVTGTPALVTTQGRLMPGYMPALQLANALGVAVDPDIAAELQKKQAAQAQR